MHTQNVRSFEFSIYIFIVKENGQDVADLIFRTPARAR
jgi:hypothetical protein